MGGNARLEGWARNVLVPKIRRVGEKRSGPEGWARNWHIGRLERGENSALLEVWHLYYPEGTEDYCGDAIAPEGL